MEITDELIQRFIAGKCGPEEADAAAAWLRLHPEVQASLLGGDDWQAAGDAGGVDHNPEQVLEQLKQRLFPGERKPFPRRLGWTVAAAVLLALAGSLIWLMQRDVREGAGSSSARSSATGSSAGDSSAKVLGAVSGIDRVNNTGQSERLSLPDGSAVVLFGHSALHYTDSFGVLRRDVRLEGKADFLVARDGARPFRVVTGRLATVVLGTSFEVRAPEGVGDVSVRLYSGKVVIRSLQTMPGWRDVFLAPGEEMVYDDHRMMVKVRKPAVRRGAGADSAGGMGDLVFNNSSLKAVFERLSLQYHKKIVYRASELAGLNFTGRLMRTDSLDTILSLLGTMNNLDIHEQPAGFVVTRRQDNP